MRGGLERCWNQIGVSGDATCARLQTVAHCRNCEEYSRASLALFDREPADSLRRAWSRRLAEPNETTETCGDSVLVFRIGVEYLAVSTTVVERVADARPVHSVPGRSSAAFLGVVNIDGELLPCFSIAGAMKFTQATAEPGAGRTVVLSHEHTRLACAVDQVVSVMRLSRGELGVPPVTVSKSARALTSAVFGIKGKVAGLLDTQKLVQRLIESVGL